MKRATRIAALGLVAGLATVAVVVLAGDDTRGDGKERISGRTDAGARHVRVRYLTGGGCIKHVRASYDRPSGRYALRLPRGASPLTLEAVARQGRVLAEERLGPEELRRNAPASASPTCERPFMGVACRKPNSVACDRVAVYVSSSLFADRVSVSIAGRRLDLPRRTGVGRDGRGTFEGFLQPAGLRNGSLRVRTEPGTDRWVGEPPVVAPVRVDVRFRGGRRASRTFRIRLAAGYG